MCQRCANSPATHSIQVYEDIPTAIQLDVSRKREKDVRAFLFRKATDEQIHSNYTVYATLHTCANCTDISIAESIGDYSVCPLYFAASSQNEHVSLVLGQYSDKPKSKTIAVLTWIEDIRDFIHEFNEQEASKTKTPFMKLSDALAKA